MNEDQSGDPQRLSRRDIARLVLGVVLFGILMGIRTELHSIWARMLVAGCAGAILGIVLAGKPPRLGRRDLARFVLGVVLFGILLGPLEEFPSRWGRALVAGCAGGVLAIALVPLGKRKS